MRPYSYFTCDVFTRQRFGGNPLVVVPDARGLDSEQMQALAQEFNYSETAFVFPAEHGETRKVRIFTPRMEVPCAGRPSIGTAFMLVELGEVVLAGHTAAVTFEEKAGIVPVYIERLAHEQVYCEMTAPEALSLGHQLSAHQLADAVGLTAEDIETKHHLPQEASVGLPFVVAEVVSRAALARANPNINHLQALQAEGIVPDIHLYTHDAEDFDLHTRMFAPLDGVMEDPATGSANGALIALLAHLKPAPSGQWQWRIAQGVDMGRPSELFGKTQKTANVVMAVHVGGFSMRMFAGDFSL